MLWHRPERDVAPPDGLRVFPVVIVGVVVPAFVTLHEIKLNLDDVESCAFFQIRKKVHWSDTDAAGVVWFPNFLRWFEDAEEELFASLGRSRQSLLDSHQFSMPRVEVQSKFRAPARAGQIVRVGIRTTIENPRRLHHAFEIRDDQSDQLLAEGFVRVACVDSGSWSPRDLPDDVLRLVSGLPDLAERQARGAVELPWT